MTEIRTLDVRGLSCPQPAMLVTQAIRKLEGGELVVLVDAGTARENVSRLAAQAGWNVSVEEGVEAGCRILLRK